MFKLPFCFFALACLLACPFAFLPYYEIKLWITKIS
ncbi:MAG: hypothetical protein MRECE_2c128 [Mycoplasmataceae bacterium CE_OT135]|nr:MAG: hypothetical protein MRECE_2c128 [Mycoplasmataceae bacterium CE_OT135]